jgi:hypothetical protein
MLETVGMATGLDVVYVCVDFNVNLLSPKIGQDVLDLEMLFLKFAVLRTVHEPTRFPSNSVLDVIAVSVPNGVPATGCGPSNIIPLPTDVSDHAFIHHVIGLVAAQHRECETCKAVRNFGERNVSDFAARLAQYSWDTLRGSGSAKDSWQNFWKFWCDASDSCFPLVRKKIRRPYRIYLPRELLSKMRHKRSMYNRYRSGRLSATEQTAYKDFKNRLNREIVRYKVMYINSELRNQVQGSAGWRRTARRHLTGATNGDVCRRLTVNGEDLAEPADIPNAFASTFGNV